MKEHSLEELDLSIPNLDTEADEIRAGEILRVLPGIEAVRFVQGGAWISYRGEIITKESICRALRQAGYRAGIFQDSETDASGQAPA